MCACLYPFTPSQTDLLFHISHSLDLCVGGHYLLLANLYMLSKSTALHPLKVGVSWFGESDNDS